MAARGGRRTITHLWLGDDASWWALIATITINALAWTTLLLIYQRAGDGLALRAQPRTPIVWLKPVTQVSTAIEAEDALPRTASTSTSQASTSQPAKLQQDPSRLTPVAASERASSEPQPSLRDRDDVWSSNQDEAVALTPKVGAAPMFRPDTLRLHRASDFPAQLARLKLRMRSAGGPEARAQLNICGALLGQWEGLRMNGSTDEAPLGMQPAGRQAVWRTLQQEGCLD